MNTRFLLTTLVCFVCLTASFGQPGQTSLTGGYVPPKRDDPYLKDINRIRRVKAWPFLREADVLWRKRVWEDIDVKQKMNYPLFYPLKDKAGRQSLWSIILEGLENGDINAYKARTADGLETDDFSQVVVDLTSLTRMTLGLGTKTIPNDIDHDGFEDNIDACDTIVGVASLDPKECGCPPKKGPEEILRYRLKEDWIFDKQRSQRFVRIIGIAPVTFNPKLNEETPLFWLYYPDCRKLFAKKETFNMMNDAFKGTFEDLFETRHFAAFVIKEENVYDRNISGLDGYAQGIDALLEGERIKKEIFEYEHDLWNY